jgi:hypothetical protein
MAIKITASLHNLILTFVQFCPKPQLYFSITTNEKFGERGEELQKVKKKVLYNVAHKCYENAPAMTPLITVRLFPAMW